MFRKTLIVANAFMLLTACTLPFAKDRNIEGALDRFEAAYVEKFGEKDSFEDDRQILSEALTRVNNRYVDEVDPNDLIDEAVKGLNNEKTGSEKPITLALNAMMSSLDSYSAYMNPESYKRYQNSLEGRFVGFGVRIEMRDGKLTVVKPIKGSPAEAAGILSDDVITHLDGNPIAGKTLIEAVTVLRGPEGSLAVLTIQRPNVSSPMVLSIKRKAVDITPVEYRVDGDVGYIRIRTFNRKTAGNVNEALDFFNNRLGTSLCGVILDMRGNPGGLVSSAVQVADEFLEDGNIFAAENRGNKFSEEDAEAGDHINGRPIMIMLNKGSASAAEIVAGALQNRHRARIFGEQSYGKGTMQTLYNLDNGGGLRFTTGRFTAGGGASFNGTGLIPDIKDTVIKNENELAPVARAGRALACNLSVQTAAAAITR